MQCERCNKKKATVFYRESVNGRARTFRLCGDCAATMQQTGELEDLSSALTRFSSSLLSTDETLLGAFPSFDSRPPSCEKGLACPSCGWPYRRFEKTGRVGCASCYTVFALPTSSEEGYKGREPRRIRWQREKLDRINELKARLADAVAKERYEEAAALRDSIRAAELPS